MLKFGTSGLRGLVSDMTDQECFINTRGFLTYLLRQALIKSGSAIILGGDLRPSTPAILQAVAAAVVDAGCEIIYAGPCPTPALLAYGLKHNCASIMVTGSHIPEDRNGIKFCKPSGEILKTDEAAILSAVAEIREQVDRGGYDGWFDQHGGFQQAPQSLPAISTEVLKDYKQRYLDFFSEPLLTGMKVVVDQHSAVGRDLLPELLAELGADVVVDGRTDYFVAIDTENVTPEARGRFQALADNHQPFAIVSTDGDSDRPFILDGQANFYRGDLVGAVVAKTLGADFAALPISSNDAIDAYLTEAAINYEKTRIGSPYVIAAMEKAVSQGYQQVVGWEVNGGFMVQSPCQRAGRQLLPLPTRDAMLPILVVLAEAWHNRDVASLFSDLNNRATQAGLIDEFPVDTSRRLIAQLSPPDQAIQEVTFHDQKITFTTSTGCQDHDRKQVSACPSSVSMWHMPEWSIELIKTGLETYYFTSEQGFSSIKAINYIDGIRLIFENNDIVHIRPSGNAPQLRVYVTCANQQRADQIVATALHSKGILRQMENDLKLAN